MIEYSYFRPEDGAVAPVRYRGTDPELNAPAGFVPIEGALDPRRCRVQLVIDDFGHQVPVVVACLPPRPQDTELQAWGWSDERGDWVAGATPAALAIEARARRDELLAACDWIVARAFETGAPVPPAWATYRAALRDLPAQPGFPDAIHWPQLPT